MHLTLLLAPLVPARISYYKTVNTSNSSVLKVINKYIASFFRKIGKFFLAL